ncbi:MAG: DUF433 domain-containing protein [Chloroflexi bacterium]|nr:DUF433 domain-containing protein [Chloroflexota bacterium]
MANRRPGYLDRIIQDPEILVGKPVVKGTRIPVELVLQHLEENFDLEDLFAAFPRLTTEDVRACLAYARATVARKRTGSTRRQVLHARAAQA